MTGRKVFLIGCSAAVLFLGIVAAAAVAWLVHVSQDPQGVAVSVEGPSAVRVGEEFTLTIVVQNQREDRPFELTDIDLADEYLSTFLILETTPPARSSMHVPLDNTRSFSFDRSVPPRGVQRFDFRLRPTAAGLFRGDVDVCEGDRFLSTLLQTWVKGDG